MDFRRIRPLAKPEDRIAAFAAVCLLLGISLPIITVESFWFFTDTASLLTAGIGLLTGAQWALGIVVLVFSVVLPPAKLAIARYAARESAVRWLGLLGQWSMLDVFVVAGTVAAIHLNVIAEAKPGPAVPFFTAGLFATAWLAHHRELEKSARMVRYGWLALLLMVVGLFLPILHAKQWLLFEQSPSLATLITQLATNGGGFTAALLIVFVVVAPALSALASIGFPISGRLADLARRWDMFPVFVVAALILALKLALDERGSVGTGWWFLAGAAALGQAGRWRSTTQVAEREG